VPSDSPDVFRFHIDTLDGNSGSAIFDPKTGNLVGLNYGTPEAYEQRVKVRYNLAVSSSAAAKVISDFHAGNK
jgi:V8-like Glu-specific endopeptidase